MKNNKKILFLLVPLMIVIWGMIAHQIFSANDQPVNAAILSNTSSNLVEAEADTVDFDLILDYEDPFKSSRSYRATHTTSTPVQTNNNLTVKNQIPKNEIKWPSIKYGGMVKSSNKREVGLLTINGKSHLVKKGDEVLEVQILSYDAEEILLKYSNQEKSFRK